MGEIADLVVVTEHELPVFGELLRLGILMHAVERGNEPVLQFTRDGFVRREHEFLDQLMRLIVLDPLQKDWLSLRVEPHFHLREIEIERALLEALAPKERRQLPGDVQTLAQLVVRPGLQNRVGLAIGQAPRAADDGSREARAAWTAISSELDENGMRQAIDARLEAANAVAQALGQHGNDAVGQINAVAALERLAIERAPGIDV